MYNAHIRYLAVAFVDAESVAPGNNEITQLIGAFDFAQLFPQVIQEPTPTGIKNRIGFSSTDGSWQFLLLSDQFHVARIALAPIGSQLGDFSEFCRQASIMLSRGLELFNRRPHRLAAIREGFLREMDETVITEKANRLLNVPDRYAGNQLNEWDWRIAVKDERNIEDLRESLNVITIIKRLNGVLSQTRPAGLPVQAQFSRIRVDFDINTIPENTAARFENRHINGFFTNVAQWHLALLNDTARFIGEEEE